MCKFNPVLSEKDQAGPWWGGWCEVRPGCQSMGLGSAGFLGRQRPGWDRAGDKHRSSLAQAGAEGPGLSWNATSGSLGCGWWSQERLGRAVKAHQCTQDPERTAQYREQDWNGTSSGFSPVMHFHVVQEQLWKSFPAVLTLFRGSGVSGHAQNQCWKRPRRSSSSTVQHCFSLTRFDFCLPNVTSFPS